MRMYKVILLRPDGSTLEERVLTCLGDDEAIERAEAIAYPHEIKLWLHDRLVAHFPKRLGFRREQQ